MGYRIKTVAELTGVPRTTILAWERRYGVTRPERTANGYREYTEADVQRILALKRAVDAGHAPSEAISFLDEPAARVAESGPPLLDRLLEALLAFQRPDALALHLASTPYPAQLHETYFPLLRLIGDGWHEGTVTVAQEHFASAWCRDQLVGMLLRIESGPARGPLVVTACYPGERHDLGILGICVRMALRGFRVAFLGADVPLDALCVTTRALAPALVCVSAVMPVPGPDLLDFARELRSAAPPRTQVVIGGGGIVPQELPRVPGVWWGQIPEG